MVSVVHSSLGLLFGILAVSTDSSNATHLRQESRSLAATYSAPDQYVAAMLARVNSERAVFGLPKLCHNSKLQAAAQRQSNDMAARNFLSHTGSDGSTMSSRITSAGYRWTALAENVAAGQVDVNSAMNSWMKSPGHRANILGSYTMLGTAYAYNAGSTYKHYWTQDFGKGSTESCDSMEAELADIDTPELAPLIPAVNATVPPMPITETPETNVTGKPDN